MSDYPERMTLRPIDNWPGRETRNRERSRFSAPWQSTLKLLDRELWHLGRGNHYPPTVLQIAMRERDFRNDGMPRANAVPAHPGVILSIEAAKGQLTIPCDKYDRWRDNLRAISMGLESLRMFDRHGLSPNNEQYTGWRAIEATPSVDAKAAACGVLARIAHPDEDAAYQAKWAPTIATNPEIGRTTLRRARANAHPDRHGGDDRQWAHVEAAAKVIGLSG